MKESVWRLKEENKTHWFLIFNLATSAKHIL